VLLQCTVRRFKFDIDICRQAFDYYDTVRAWLLVSVAPACIHQ
jgi:hypothetical protein